MALVLSVFVLASPVGFPASASAEIVGEIAKLIASDAAPRDRFGSNVAVDGDTMVVGANGDDGDRGAAYVFVRFGDAWVEQQKLVPSSPRGIDVFGNAVAIDGDTVVVGAVFWGEPNRGAAYVFTRSNGVWSQQQQLLASDSRSDYAFGRAVAVQGDTILVGDDSWGMYVGRYGAVYVFTRSADQWSQQQVVTAPDQEERDYFGGAIALDGESVLIGASGDDDSASNAGAAYMFRRSEGVWTFQQKLRAADGAAGDGFGLSVALRGGTALIGAMYDADDATGAIGAGASYVYQLVGTTWLQQQKLVAGDREGSDLFGSSVAVAADTAVVGAVQDDDNGTDAGSVYVFKKSGGQWTEQLKLLASDGSAHDQLGGWVSRGIGFHADTVIAGAPANDATGTAMPGDGSGAVYVFDIAQLFGSPRLASLSLMRSEIVGCKSGTGTVTLSGPAPPGGLTVAVSDTLASALPPTTVTIPGGATSKRFSIKTVPTATSESGEVTVNLGASSLSQPLTVRPMGLASLTLSPGTVVGGQNATGTATLECAAGPGPVTVGLSSNRVAVAFPVAMNVVVPQGLKSARFTVASSAVLEKTYAMITGQASTTTKTRKLSVVPAADVSPRTLRFGGIAVNQTSAPLDTVLSNLGAVPFSVDSISLTGTSASWFAQTNNCPANLAAGASCRISVRFIPQAALSKSAKLSIATSATSTPLSVSLTGTGI